MIKENLCNISKKADFLEQTLKSELTERTKNKNKKIQQHNLKMHLNKHFYHYFKKYQGNTKRDMIDFYDIDIRETIIQQLGEYDGDKMSYLNSIYSKSLNEISRIFKDNDKFLETQKEKLSFEEMCNVSMELMNKYRKTPTTKSKLYSSTFITLLNLILSPWKK